MTEKEFVQALIDKLKPLKIDITQKSAHVYELRHGTATCWSYTELDFQTMRNSAADSSGVVSGFIDNETYPPVIVKHRHSTLYPIYLDDPLLEAITPLIQKNIYRWSVIPHGPPEVKSGDYYYDAEYLYILTKMAQTKDQNDFFSEYSRLIIRGNIFLTGLVPLANEIARLKGIDETKLKEICERLVGNKVAATELAA